MNNLHPIMQAALAPFMQNVKVIDPGQITEDEWVAADLAGLNKVEQRDAAALALQIKYQPKDPA